MYLKVEILLGNFEETFCAHCIQSRYSQKITVCFTEQFCCIVLKNVYTGCTIYIVPLHSLGSNVL